MALVKRRPPPADAQRIVGAALEPACELAAALMRHAATAELSGGELRSVAQVAASLARQALALAGDCARLSLALSERLPAGERPTLH